MDVSEDYAARFGGIGRLYGIDAMPVLAKAHVCVVGVGGVGSWTVEALARSGVGKLTLVDLDDICVNNTNRQLHTMEDTVGRQKIDVMAERARSINPEVKRRSCGSVASLAVICAPDRSSRGVFEVMS